MDEETYIDTGYTEDGYVEIYEYVIYIDSGYIEDGYIKSQPPQSRGQ